MRWVWDVLNNDPAENERHTMDAIAEFFQAFSRPLPAAPERKIKSASARLGADARRHDPVPGHVPQVIRSMSSELLEQSQELTKADFIPEDTRARVVMGLWNVALPLERYAGCSDEDRERKLLEFVRCLRSACDEILLPDPDAPEQRAERLEAAIDNIDGETYQMIRAL